MTEDLEQTQEVLDELYNMLLDNFYLSYLPPININANRT